MRASPWIAVGGLTFALLALPLLAQNPAAVPVAEKPTAKLPITRVTLFNAGIGYFQREGMIDGDTRVDLKVNEEDVNDLILTLLANDPTGKSLAVTYDNKAPAEITLKAFSIDLTENPGLGNLLHQVRGEKVDITDQNGSQLAGQIVSVETPSAIAVAAATPAAPPVENVSILTEDGLQSLPLSRIKKVKFAKAELQAEFRKALEALAAARGASTKSVGVTFNGQGQRKVSVGYIADAPLWKPTYRLKLDNGKPTIQGFAAIENTTDEDWENVKVKLVSGRPVTFKMDLYDPLFVPRPVVEPELYASLRPPMYQGVVAGNLGGGVGMMGQFGGGFQGGGGFAGGNTLQQNLAGNGANVQSAANLGVGGGFAGMTVGTIYNYGYGSITRPSVRALMGQRLNYESLRDRASMPTGSANTSTLPLAAASSIGNLGESFEFDVAQPVSLARFKSALVPVIRETLESKQVSIFNPQILPGYPMKGIYLKNASKVYFPQGPVTIYEGDTVAGQARLPDMNPGESRLLSFAVDLDVRVAIQETEGVRTPVSLKLKDGVLIRVTAVKETTTYEAFNKSSAPKTVWITQAIKEKWKLVAPAKPAEQTTNLYRFEVIVPPQIKISLDVVEETEQTENTPLANLSNIQLEDLEKKPAANALVKAAIAKLRTAYATKAAVTESIHEEQQSLKEIGEEQKRIRENLAVTPKESDAYKRYIKKFDDQETEIEKRRAKLKDLNAVLAKETKDTELLLKTLSAE